MDSLASETEVLESQETFADVDESDAADALLCIASTDVSTFKPDKELDAATSLMEKNFARCWAW